MNLNFQISRRLLGLYTRFSLYVILGVAAALILIGYVLLIGPKWTEISSVGLSDYKKEQLRLDADKEYLTALQTLVAKYDAFNQSRLDEIEQIIPTGDQLPALFVQMEAMVKDAGMQLDSISFETNAEASVTTSSPLNTLNIAIQVSGGARYTDMKLLVDTIEKNQRLLDLVSIAFTLDETDIVAAEGAQGGSYQLTLRTYYLSETSLTDPSGQTPDPNTFLQGIEEQT